MNAFVTVALAAILFPAIAAGQATLPGVSPQYEYEAAMKTLDRERRVVIAGELMLKETERDAFWSLYGEYTAEIRAVSDARARTIGEFARSYDSMTDDIARRLLEDALRQDEQRVKIRSKYMSRFRKILPDTKVVRLYQVENKLDAALEYNLASQIPLIPDENR